MTGLATWPFATWSVATLLAQRAAGPSSDTDMATAGDGAAELSMTKAFTRPTIPGKPRAGP